MKPSEHPQTIIHKLSTFSAKEFENTGDQDATSMASEEATQFWAHAARDVIWTKPPTIVYGRSNSKERPSWFSGQ